MFFKQIKKFHCLKSPSAQGPQHGTLRRHMAHVPKRVLKFLNFIVQNLQKPYMIDLLTHSNLISDALWSICHIGGLRPPL